MSGRRIGVPWFRLPSSEAEGLRTLVLRLRLEYLSSTSLSLLLRLEFSISSWVRLWRSSSEALEESFKFFPAISNCQLNYHYMNDRIVELLPIAVVSWDEIQQKHECVSVENGIGFKRSQESDKSQKVMKAKWKRHQEQEHTLELRVSREQCMNRGHREQKAVD